MKITTQIKFDAAHRLMHHSGKCNDLHGHTYTVTVSVIGDVQRQSGMVTDFGVLKALLKLNVIDRYDHKTILNENDELHRHLHPDEVVLFPFEPTAENLATRIFTDLRTHVAAEGCLLYSITVHETPTSWATFSLEDWETLCH